MNRWMVFVAAIWLQSCAGLGYVFGSISPTLKTALGINQKQINVLGVAKDLGDSIGFFAGVLCQVVPTWALILVGALQHLLGYGCIWLIVASKIEPFPFWTICLLIFVATNGETYFNTASLVSCVQTFPSARGPVVGILKGFCGLSGAIFTQIYTAIFAPNKSAFIFTVAVGPFMVAVSLMFILRPLHSTVATHPQRDNRNFNFMYSVCMVVAAYLLAVMIVQDQLSLSRMMELLLTALLLFILLSPLAMPIASALTATRDQPINVPLLENEKKQENEEQKSDVERQDRAETNLSDETGKTEDLTTGEKGKRSGCMGRLRVRWFTVAATETDAVNFKRKRSGPHRGENFTLLQALRKADFWLLFFALVCGGGAGLTIIDNMGQIAESRGSSSHMFVSMISIWNFLGRVAGGFLSEIVAREKAHPRPIALAVAQVIMALGQGVFATGWWGSLHGGTFLVGLGYGAHWSIIPATASELFGLRNFGSLYNFMTMANPMGSLFFSGVIAGSLYDWEAKKQHLQHKALTVLKDAEDDALKCVGLQCFFITHIIMLVVCVVGAVLSLILSYRTSVVYANIHGGGHRSFQHKSEGSNQRNENLVD